MTTELCITKNFWSGHAAFSNTHSRQKKTHPMSRPKEHGNKDKVTVWLLPPVPAGHTCAYMHASMQTNHTLGYISGRWDHSSFIHVSPILTFSLKGVYYFYNHKKHQYKLFWKRKSALRKFPHPCKIITCTRNEHHPSCARDCKREQETLQHLHRQPVWDLESAPFPGEKGGNENWVFCCVSCKHALGSYPFPLPLPSPLSHKFSSMVSLLHVSSLDWPIL